MYLSHLFQFDIHISCAVQVFGCYYFRINYDKFMKLTLFVLKQCGHILLKVMSVEMNFMVN